MQNVTNMTLVVMMGQESTSQLDGEELRSDVPLSTWKIVSLWQTNITMENHYF